MSKNKEPRPRCTFTPELKQQIVDLYRGDKRKCGIIREYDIANSLLDKWIAQADYSGSFKEKDNRSTEDAELIRLRKENQQHKMENDILKQAALILGQK
ncbi:MAG: transposase [Paenibacillaceae bacterium]|nr:transposase [Paenibacillaceae bacterium]